MAETKEERPDEIGPGKPGYYSPPDPPPVVAPQNPPPPPATAAIAEDTPPAAEVEAEAEAADYEDMTVAELKDLAAKRGVEIHSDMLKADIIDALEADDKK